MNKRWTEFNLGGGGLQSANLQLAALLRKRSSAYALLALFPLGLHRDYLRDPRGAWLYRAGTGLAVASYLLGENMISAGVLAVLSVGAIIDMLRLEHVIVRVNKQLRMQVYLRQTPGAPSDFKGRFGDERQGDDLRDNNQADVDQAQSESGHPRIPSFAEQEKLLREMARKHSRADK